MGEKGSFYQRIKSGVQRGKELFWHPKAKETVIFNLKPGERVSDPQKSKALVDEAQRIQEEEEIPFRDIAESMGISSDILEYHAKKRGVKSTFAGGYNNPLLREKAYNSRQQPEAKQHRKEKSKQKKERKRRDKIRTAIKEVWKNARARRLQQSERMKKIAQNKRLDQEKFEERKQMRLQAIDEGVYELLPDQERRAFDEWYAREYEEMPTITQASTDLNVPPTTAKRHHDHALEHLQAFTQSQTVDKAE